MKSRVVITYRDQNGEIIENPVEGQRAYSPEANKLFLYTNGNWEEISGDVNLGMSLYDLNKQAIAQLPCLNEEGMISAKKTINDYGNTINNNFYMLLCREANYYTLFNINRENSELENFGELVLECATDLGALKSVELTEDGNAIEIWVHCANREPDVMYLFGYDAGVVECIL